MSLVNNMLNDLEQRRNKETNKIEKLHWLTQPVSLDGELAPSIWRWVVLAITAGLLVILLFFLVNHSPVKVESHLIKNDFTVNEANVSRELLSVTTDQVGDEVLIRLLLSSVPGYQVNKQDDDLIIRLSGLDQNLPKEVDDMLSPVRSLSFRRDEGDLLLILALSQPVEHRFSLRMEPSIQLELNIKSLAETVVNEAPVVSPLSRSTLLATGKARNGMPTSEPRAVKKRLLLSLEQRDQQSVKEAQQDLKKGEFELAEKRLRKQIEQWPTSSSSRELLLAILLEQHRLTEADDLLVNLQQNTTTSLGLLRMKARLYLLQGQPGLAVALLQERMPSIQREFEYYELLALASQRDKQYILSGKIYKALLGEDRGRGDWWAGLAIAQDFQGQKADARNSYQQVLRINRTPGTLREYAKRRYLALAGMVNQSEHNNSEGQ